MTCAMASVPSGVTWNGAANAEKSGANEKSVTGGDGGHNGGRAGEIAQRKERGFVGGDESTALQPDECDEQTDADADGASERYGDGIHDGFTQAAKHQQQDEDAFQEHDGHGHAPVHAEAEAQRIGDDGVDAHPGGERDGTVREQAHRDRHDGGAETGRGQCGVERDSRRLHHRRIHRDDVRHGEKRRKAANDFVGDSAASLGYLEELV